jgi:Astacin (Peptidase family M12A)
VLIIQKNVLMVFFQASDQVRLIRLAMDAVEAVTCVRFKVRKYEKDFVSIHSGQFCKSYLGRIGGPQEMSLNNKLCFQKGIIIHELLHALGYIHMHNRPDRDKHIKILWQNIDQRFYSEFDKVDGAMYNYYGTGYGSYFVFGLNCGKNIANEGKFKFH